MTILPFTLSVVDNRVCCAGSLGLKHIDKVIAEILRLDSEQIVLDLSAVERCTPAQVMPLGMFLANQRGKGKNFSVITPRNKKEHNRFNDTGLSAILDPAHFHQPVSTNNHLSIRRFEDDYGMNKATAAIVGNVLTRVQFADRQAFSAFEWVMYELADNTLLHANSSSGTLLLVDYIFDQSIIQITICDGGVTIPATLQDQYPDLDDPSLIVKSLERGVGRRDNSGHLIGGGNGLYGAFRLAECSHGALFIRSRRGLVQLKRHRLPDGSKSFHAKTWTSPSALMPGTFLQFSLKFTEPDLVRRALAFSGISQGHIWDSIEGIEDEHPNGIVVSVAQRSHEVKSRAGGRAFGAYVRNLMNLSTHLLILDFSGVSAISSSFADEVFTKAGLSAERVRIRGAEESVSLIIDSFGPLTTQPAGWG